MGNNRRGARRPDCRRLNLVIVDFQMSGMNGLETARQLLDIAPAVPVVMVTQHASPNLQKLAHAVSIRTVVSKMDAFPVAGIIEALLGSDDSSGSAPNLGLGCWLGLQDRNRRW